MSVTQRRRAISRCARIAFALLVVACSHGNQPEVDDLPPREPIAVHVRNENYLDMNVSVVVSGVSRRLGQVTGNSSGDFSITWPTVGQQIALTATAIGSRSTYTSAALSVGNGQMVEFHIGTVLRQSSAVVREP
jgi:hypothetical protein